MNKKEYRKKFRKLAIKYITDELTDEDVFFIIKNGKGENWDFFLTEIHKHYLKELDTNDKRKELKNGSR